MLPLKDITVLCGASSYSRILITWSGSQSRGMTQAWKNLSDINVFAGLSLVSMQETGGCDWIIKIRNTKMILTSQCPTISKRKDER